MVDKGRQWTKAFGTIKNVYGRLFQKQYGIEYYGGAGKMAMAGAGDGLEGG